MLRLTQSERVERRRLPAESDVERAPNGLTGSITDLEAARPSAIVSMSVERSHSWWLRVSHLTE